MVQLINIINSSSSNNNSYNSEYQQKTIESETIETIQVTNPIISNKQKNNKITAVLQKVCYPKNVIEQFKFASSITVDSSDNNNNSKFSKLLNSIIAQHPEQSSTLHYVDIEVNCSQLAARMAELVKNFDIMMDDNDEYDDDEDYYNDVEQKNPMKLLLKNS